MSKLTDLGNRMAEVVIEERKKATRFVIVELFDDAELLASEVANDIVVLIPDAKEAYPAYSDGFGRIVRNGEIVYG